MISLSFTVQSAGWHGHGAFHSTVVRNRSHRFPTHRLAIVVSDRPVPLLGCRVVERHVRPQFVIKRLHMALREVKPAVQRCERKRERWSEPGGLPPPLGQRGGRESMLTSERPNGEATGGQTRQPFGAFLRSRWAGAGNAAKSHSPFMPIPTSPPPDAVRRTLTFVEFLEAVAQSASGIQAVALVVQVHVLAVHIPPQSLDEPVV